MTTHSHTAGFLHESVLSFDCVLPNGEYVQNVSPFHEDEVGWVTALPSLFLTISLFS